MSSTGRRSVSSTRRSGTSSRSSKLVHGGLRYYDGGDQLWWKAIYANRSFPVYSGQVRVTVPSGAEIHEWAAYVAENDARNIATATLADGSQEILFDVDSRLQSGEDFEVRVEFTDGVVAGSIEPWQAQADAEAAAREEERAFRERWAPVANLGFGGIGLLAALGGPAALYALWYRRGRDKPVEMVAGVGIKPGESKTKAIECADPPRDKKSIKSFLGLCGFFSRHVVGYQQIAHPLNKLLRKDSGYVSGDLPDEAQEAFETLKKALISRPVLAPQR